MTVTLKPSTVESLTKTIPSECPFPTREQILETLCAEAYVTLGSILCDLGGREPPELVKVMDNLSELRLVHNDGVPFPSLLDRIVVMPEGVTPAAYEGPDGFKTWKDAAMAERVRRVAAEKLLKDVKSTAEPGCPPVVLTSAIEGIPAALVAEAQRYEMKKTKKEV